MVRGTQGHVVNGHVCYEVSAAITSSSNPQLFSATQGWTLCHFWIILVGISLGSQSGWTKDEILLEILIWDVSYCKEASKIRCSIPRKLGQSKTGIINSGIILAFLNNGIVRIKRGGRNPEGITQKQLGTTRQQYKYKRVQKVFPVSGWSFAVKS